MNSALKSLRYRLGLFMHARFGFGRRQPEVKQQTEKQPEFVWCLVANIVDERPYGAQGKETRPGTKHFAAGAKIYCFPTEWGDGYERVRVIGRHRGSHRLVTIIIKTDWLTNWRAQKVYKPSVIERLDGAWEEAAKYASVSPEQQIGGYAKMMETRQNSSA